MYNFDIRTLGRRTHTHPFVKARLAVGRILSRYFPDNKLPKALHDARAEAQYFQQLREFDKVQHTESDRMPTKKVADMCEYDFSDEILDSWDNTFRSNPESNIQAYVMPMLRKILSEDDEVRSVLNIGIKIAYFDSILAAENPDRQFVGVDFMKRLNEFNSRYHQPNLKFVSGYARDLLESEELAADLAFFSSTAVIIRNKELRKNISLIRKNAKYIVFNEPMYTFPGYRDIVDPSKVAIDSSYLLATPDIPPGYEAPPPANRSLVFVHNYAAMVEEAGFEIIHYEIVMKDGVLPLMNLVGKAR